MVSEGKKHFPNYTPRGVFLDRKKQKPKTYFPKIFSEISGTVGCKSQHFTEISLLLMGSYFHGICEVSADVVLYYTTYGLFSPVKDARDSTWVEEKYPLKIGESIIKLKWMRSRGIRKKSVKRFIRFLEETLKHKEKLYVGEKQRRTTRVTWKVLFLTRLEIFLNCRGRYKQKCSAKNH